jgi:hypothetical protein
MVVLVLGYALYKGTFVSRVKEEVIALKKH